MNKKFFIGAFTTLFALVTIGLSSCSSDENENNIKINITELGAENSKIANVGSDMHVEADVEADALIAGISTTLKQKDGDFKIENSFDDYNGVRNAEFHKHIEIPANTPAGDYTFTISVTD